MFMGLPCLPRYGSVGGTPSGRSGEAADEGERGLRDLGDSGVIGAVWVHLIDAADCGRLVLVLRDRYLGVVLYGGVIAQCLRTVLQGCDVLPHS